MSQSELTFLMVKVSGGDETIRQAVASALQIILHDLTPATPPPALAADRAAALPVPVQGRAIETSAAGGVSTGMNSPALPAPTVPSKPNGHARQAKASAAPAQASNHQGKSEVASQKGARKLRSDSTLFECSIKPGAALTMKEVCAMTTWSNSGVRSRMNKADGDWFEVDTYKFRRMRPGISATPSASTHETRPRARADVSPINPNLVGRAAAHTPQEISISAE